MQTKKNAIDKIRMNVIHKRMKNWSDYPILLAVAETGSLTAAGKKLNMSQPTVGRRIRALEDHFQTGLLKKEQGVLVPTAFGHSVLDHIRRMETEASAINRSSASLEQSLAGPVRISTTEGVGTDWLPPVMQVFRTAHPDLLLDVSIDFRTFNLAQREADIALRWMGPGSQNSLIGRKVAEVGFGLFASKAYLERNPEPITTKADLAKHDSVTVFVSENEYLWPKNEEGMHVPMGRLTFKSNNIVAHRNAILNGYGIGILPICFAEFVPTTNLHRVLPDHTHHEDLWIVAHEDLTKSVRIRAVFDFLVDAIVKDRGFFYSGAPSVFSDGVDLECGDSRLGTPGHPHIIVPRIEA